MQEEVRKKIEKENKLFNELETLRGEYRKCCQKWFCIGILFSILSVIFAVMGYVTNNPGVILGAIIQLIAGTILILNNIRGGIKEW